MRPQPLALIALLLAGCPASSSESTDAKVYDYTKANVSDTKALIYNLIGRWYPLREIERLDDDTMTPEQWCAKEPEHIFVHLSEVEVRCTDGTGYNSPIARIDRSEQGGIMLVMRAPEDAKFKSLTFKDVITKEDDEIRPKATILGSPCLAEPKAETFARFPKIEILERQILNGRHCSQITLPK